VARGGDGAALVVAVEAQRMNDPIFWPTLAWGLACYVVFYGRALLIEHRQDRRRQAKLRRRLYGS
jgi:hypothetical protein